MKKILFFFTAFVFITSLSLNNVNFAFAEGSSASITISSFEDLKQYLDYKSIKKTESDTEPVERLVLKGGNYEIVSSFEIDLEDSYFSGKEDAIKYGLISTEDDFSIKGNGNTISFKQDEAVALFGMVDSPAYEIDGLKIAYPKDVFGFAFAQKLKSKDDGMGTAIAKGLVKNIDISVGGDVKPLKVIGNEKSSNHFIGQYNGVISTGFSWYIDSTNIENLNINIMGNIGSTQRPNEEKDMVAAYGLTHHFDNVPYTKNYNAETWKELHDRGNPEVLKDAGHIIGLSLNVGGNIQAYGNNTGYSAGVGQDMASAWMERINIKIDGDIITDLNGNTTPMIQSYTSPYAFGFSDEVMNLTDSSLKVGNIIFISNNLPESSDLTLVGAVANNNSKGNYINIKNNTIEVEGKIEGKSNQNLLASIGFGNDWNSFQDRGTNWIQESEYNVYTVGKVDLESDKVVVFNSLGKKWRTGKEPLGSYVLPEASLKNEKVTTGDITITAGEQASVSLLMNNASNAKNNTLEYGNIVIKANKTNFYGMGNLQNDKPKENFYENITENNNITMKDLTIETKDAQYISLMAGVQHAEQQLKNNTVKADNVIIKLNSSQNTYISGIAGYSLSPIDSCRVFLGSIHVENSGDKNVYFGLGAARTDKSIKNSGVFVDGNIEIESKTLYGGGFIGFAKNSTIEGNDFQVDGINNISLESGTYGGFGGWITNGTTKNNSSLILNDFMPFIGYSDSGTIENCSHYVNKKAPKFFSALLASGKNNPVISNSTLLVEKDFEDMILYRKDIISGSSENNYVVVVDNDAIFNRVAYKVAETTSTEDEMGAVMAVFKKIGEPIGKINIKARSFQDKYWNVAVAPYEIGDQEKSFDYMIQNGAGTISEFGIDSHNIVLNEGAKGTLTDYYHRHAGLVSDKGIVYDLLGIKGSTKKTSGGSGGVDPYEDQEKDKKSTPTTETKLNTVDHYAYMVGYPDLTFKADKQMTRAEVTMMFARLLKDRPVGTPFMPSRYSDIVESNWYSYAVDYMSEQNIVTGYPDGTFRPNAPITRAEFAAMSARFDKLTDAGNSTFTDVSANHWASKVIAQAGSKGWVSGYPDGTFKPNQNITRAEVVSSTNRILNRYADVEFAKAYKEELAPMIDIAETHWGYEAIVEAMNGHDYVRQADGKTEKWERLNGKSFTFPTPLSK